jgi:hypothetical protein
MILQVCRAVAIAACAAAVLLPTVTSPQAQPGAEPCRQGLLALIMVIDADEHDRPFYRSAVKAVMEMCSPPAAAKQVAAPNAGFDKQLCGRLAAAMFDSTDSGKLDSPQFVKARDDFAARCMPTPAP